MYTYDAVLRVRKNVEESAMLLTFIENFIRIKCELSLFDSSNSAQ